MVHSVYCCLRKVHTTATPNHQSIFDRVLAQTAEKTKPRRKKTIKMTHLAAASVNMISRGRHLFRSRRYRRGSFTPPISSPDSDYSPGLSQVLVHQEGAFQGTHFRVAIPYDYGQPSSLTGAVLPTPLKNLFQWSNDEEEASVYASLATISSVRMDLVSATWPTIMMMTSVGRWRHKSRLSGPSKKL